jgi:hypothetical protein
MLYLIMSMPRRRSLARALWSGILTRGPPRRDAMLAIDRRERNRNPSPGRFTLRRVFL